MLGQKKCCQSCGIPWDKDPMAGGTNNDGSKSETYCNYCFKNGVFVQPDWSLQDMQAYAIKVLSKRGVPEIMGKLLTQGIAQLERWRK